MTSPPIDQQQAAEAHAWKSNSDYVDEPMRKGEFLGPPSQPGIGRTEREDRESVIAEAEDLANIRGGDFALLSPDEMASFLGRISHATVCTPDGLSAPAQRALVSAATQETINRLEREQLMRGGHIEFHCGYHAALSDVRAALESEVEPSSLSGQLEPDSKRPSR